MQTVKSILAVMAIWISLSSFGCQYFRKHTVINPVITDDLLISLDRRGCMGTCPVYAINITSDGSVSFDGKSFTKLEGKAQDRVSQAEVQKLVAEFKKADFFGLDKNYGDCEDTPLEVITFVQNGITKTVSHGERCDGTPEKAEEAIANLGRQIDVVTRSDRWVNVYSTK